MTTCEFTSSAVASTIVEFGDYPVDYTDPILGLTIVGGLSHLGSDQATPFGISNRGLYFDGCGKYLRVGNFIQHHSISHDFYLNISEEVEYTKVMTIFSTVQNPYARYSADRGAEVM